ncbi:20339_t:CDS:2, partial [Gigaspora rosea]
DNVANFMKKYAVKKGHGIRIGGGGRKVNIWAKKDKNWLEVTTFNNEHVGHVLNPLASQFDPTLRKLPKEIVKEIHFLTTVARADTTMQYRIIQEKFKVRIHWPDLYSTIQKFRHEIIPGEDDAGLHWYKEELQETDISNNEFISVSPKTLASATKTHLLPAQFLHCEPNFIRAEEFTNCISNQSANEISKAISKKRKFGELWGLEKKIMVEAIEDSNEDIYHELLGFLMSIQRRTSQRTINETNNSVNDNINDDDHMMEAQYEN